MESEDEDKKQKQAKGWFLTYPKCPIKKEDALELLKATGKIKEYVICEEEHKDGSPHLHAYIKYTRKQTWNKTKWDLLTYHGNYGSERSYKGCLKYCKKKGDYISNIDIESALAKKGKKTNKELLTMCPRRAVEEEHCTPF